MNKQEKLNICEKSKEEMSKGLIRLRQKHNLSQSQLASILKISPTTIKNWENKKGNPLLSHLYRICKIFGLSFKDFFEE